MCGDFNLTKSKTKSKTDPTAESQINKRTIYNSFDANFYANAVFPKWEITKKRAEMNILLNNQIHKGGEEVTEMDGMAIFVNESLTNASVSTSANNSSQGFVKLTEKFGLELEDKTNPDQLKPFVRGEGESQQVIVGGGNRKRTRKNRVKRTRKGSRNYRKPARRTKRNKRSVKSRRRRSR